MTTEAMTNGILLMMFERDGAWFISMESPGVGPEEIEFPNREVARDALRRALAKAQTMTAVENIDVHYTGIVHRTTEADFQQHGSHLKMFVVYENPKDFPGMFVVREWRVEGEKGMPTKHFWISDTLERVRTFIPGGYARMEADTKDDPCIVEVWL